MKIVCINNQVLLQPEKTSEKVVNGIVIQETSTSRVARGVVVDAFDTVVYRLGDVVLYAKEASVEIREDGILFVLVHADQCLAILRPEPKSANLTSLDFPIASGS